MTEACGKCTISLLCLGGFIRDMQLCPRCGILQVTTEERNPIFEIFEAVGAATVQGDVRTHRIECPERYLEEDQYYDWCQQGESDAAGDYDIDEGPENARYDARYDAMAELSASILIHDKGPPQKQNKHVESTLNLLLVALCNDCHGYEQTIKLND